MKKKISFILLLMSLIVPFNVKALEYISELSGNEYIFSPSSTPMDRFNTRDLYINISNMYNIGSFDMYVKYDTELIDMCTCSFLNYIAGFCQRTDDHMVIYPYEYQNVYIEKFNKYNFYTVTFMSKSQTRESGTTTIEVFFKNAKDINGNPITISSSSKTYQFSKFFMKWTSDNNNDEEQQEVNSENSSSTIEEDNKSTPNTNNNSNNNAPIIEEKNTPNIDQNNPSFPEKNEYSKSTNNYLKSIKINNDHINFNKNQNNYEITINPNINKLNLEIELEDSKATYNIIGADNLLENDYKVLIEVTSESGDKNTYTINVKINEYDEVVDSGDKIEANEKENFKIDKKYIIMGIIGLSVIVVIIVVVAIISYHNNKKMDRIWDEF